MIKAVLPSIVAITTNAMLGSGIVSAVGRTLTELQTCDSPGATLPDSIQTSAAINPR